MRLSSKKIISAFLILLLALAFSVAFSLGKTQTRLMSKQVSIPGASVNLDATIYYPEKVPAPLLLIAHGFGGDKNSVAQEATFFQQHGYLVVAWSARGFGNSSGQINMNAPDKEVADASKIIDFMLAQPSSVKSVSDKPQIGVMGSSYGGALALLLGESDRRISAIVSDITWADLRQSLFPQSASPAPVTGPFKKVWAGTFFSLSTLSNAYLGECGNFAAQWCQAFKKAATNSQGNVTLNSNELELLRNSSPVKAGAEIKAPTLIMQGEDDSLFPLSESLANLTHLFKSSAANVSLIWHSGGHDGGNPEAKRLSQLSLDWFDKYLTGKNKLIPKFEVTDSRGTLSVTDSTAVPTILKSDQLPSAAQYENIKLNGSLGAFFAPIGGQPAAVSSLPGIGSASSLSSGILNSLGATNSAGIRFGSSTALLPGQSAQFASLPITVPINVVGSSKIRVKVTSTTSEATLFFSLMAESRNGALRQPGGIVSPVRLSKIPKSGMAVEINLPAIFLKLAPGERLVVAVSATDQGYALPSEGRFYTVTPISDLTFPTLILNQVGASKDLIFWPILTLITLIIALFYLYFKREKVRPKISVDQKHLIQITNLSKIYSDGFQAVDNLSFNVGRGQVLGLLGPNGAGKTTTLRILMGLIHPTSGSIYIDGEPVYPGAPALAKLGSFVEGPGFLPHLTGRENLDIYWKSIGRTTDPKLNEVISITKLGSALDKKVRSYSQGMRQRLAIAQAMLGLPEILVLDEPTNGLDPQQIAEMRKVLKNYTKNGRTVIISSHLLAEIQQTSTHVVLMHRGKLLATGTMKKILKKSKSLEDIFLEIIGDDLIIGGDL